MKIYKNQTEQSANLLGYKSNVAFASDPQMSPKGIDVTMVRKQGVKEPYQYEVTTWDKQTKTARIEIMSPSEYNKWESSKTL